MLLKFKMKRYTLILAGLLIASGLLIGSGASALVEDYIDVNTVKFYEDENTYRIEFTVIQNFTNTWIKGIDAQEFNYLFQKDGIYIDTGTRYFTIGPNTYPNTTGFGPVGFVKDYSVLGSGLDSYTENFYAGETYNVYLVNIDPLAEGRDPYLNGTLYPDDFTPYDHIGDTSLYVNLIQENVLETYTVYWSEYSAEPEPPAGIDLGVNASGSVAGIFTYVGDAFNDLSPIWALLIGLPLGFWFITKVIGIIKKRTE